MSKQGTVAAMRASALATMILALLPVAMAAEHQRWIVQTSGLDTNLRGVSAVYFSTKAGEVPKPAVWASGSNGVILRSLDEGKTWKRLHVEGGDALDLRGIVALDDKVAYVMSIGNGDKSRIYKTTDGGVTWTLQYSGKRKEIFLDAIVCPDPTHCYALGDPVDGKFLLLHSADGDAWEELPRDNMPAALPNEGAFAASNSSLCVDDQNIYFGTGGAAKARLFRSADSGKTWSVEETPIASGNTSSGIFSVSCQGGLVLHAVGGDYNDPSRVFHSAAAFYGETYLSDKLRGWQLAKQQPGGFRSGVANVDGAMAVAVGPNGEDITQDFGITWEHTDSLNLNAVFILALRDGWAVGPKGTIARFQNRKQYIIRNEAPPNEPTARATDRSLPHADSLSTLPRPSRADFASSGSARGTGAGREYVIYLN